MYIPQWYTWPGLPGYQMSQLGQKNYTFTRYNQLSSKYLKSPKKQISQLSGHLNRHLAGGTLQVLWGGQEYPMGQLGQKNTFSPDIVVGFEIFKTAQETKKLASRVPKWASPRGTLQVPRGAQGVPRDVNHGSGRQKKNIHFQIFIKLCINFDLRH